jgi:hypothetical protein
MVQIKPHLNHMVESNFNPGNARAPPSGYVVNVDNESILRNQTFALNHGADQSVYIPSSNSDLYKTTVVSRPSHQPHPQLFQRPQFSSHIHPNLIDNSIGQDRFYNHTRTQLRNT